MSDRLSQHLTLPEFLHTAHRDLLDEQEAWWNDPDHGELRSNALRLALAFEKVRAIVGPCVISSGLRCPALNRAVGGAGSKPGQKLSAHTSARALDLVPTRMGIVDAVVAIREAVIQGQLRELDKAILEFGRWVHVQVPAPGELAKQQLLMTWDGAAYPAFTVADARVVARRRVA